MSKLPSKPPTSRGTLSSNMRHNFDPQDPITRKLIDEHKTARLADPWKARAFAKNKENPTWAFRLWVEQVGDAELYKQAYLERTQDVQG